MKRAAEPKSPKLDTVTQMIARKMRDTDTSVVALVKGSGVSRGAVYEALSGKRGLRADTAERLFRFLKTRRTKG